MTCNECNTRNPIGNKFCRECGAKVVIPEGSPAAEEAARADVERKAERAAILLSEAHLLAEQGKYIAAIPVAEEAAATLPFSASALSFLVTLYEHTSQMEKAVAVQTRVVESLPNAANESTRLEKLKRGDLTTPPPGRTISETNVPTLRGATPGTVPLILPQWFPIAAGVVGGGFALYLGFLAMSPRSPSGNSAILNKPVPIVVTSPSPEPSVMTVNPGAMPPPVQDPMRGGDPFVSIDEARRNAQLANRTATPTPPASAPLPAPKPLPGAIVSRPKTAPVILSPDIIKVSKGSSNTEPELPPISAAPPASNNPVEGFGNGERLSAAPPNPSTVSPPKSTSYMKITVNQHPTNTVISAAPPKSSTPADMESDPLERARVLQGLGRYTDAISAYREAIAAGSPLGETQQSIALCFQRAGDAASAKVAYIQAIAAYKAQIAAGKNPSSAQRGLDTCEAAIGIL